MRFRQRSDNLILMSLLGAIIGLLYSFAEHALKGTELGPLIIRAVSCLILIFLSISFASRAMRSWFKGKTFLFAVLWQTLVYVLIIIFWLAVINGINQAYINKTPFLLESIYYLWYSDMFWINLLTVFCVAIIFSSLMEINTLHRKGELFKYITGLYHRPKEVERVFMFADMKSSTAIAEKLGNLEFGNLLQDFFSDISEAVFKSRGEVYGYVGDEIIVNWKYQHAINDNQCIRCFFDMQKAISIRSEYYLRKYGVVPELKAGLHAGKVVVMWVGDQKKEIVYLGDVLNTASRIQSECNRLGEKLLASGQVISRMSLPGEFIARPMGEIELRGKEEKVSLFGIIEPGN